LRLIAKVHEHTKVADVITVDAVELRLAIVAVPAPQGMMTMNAASPAMLDCGTHGFARVQVQVHGIRLFDWMDPEEANGYHKMLEDLNQAVRKRKLAEEAAAIAAQGFSGGSRQD